MKRFLFNNKTDLTDLTREETIERFEYLSLKVDKISDAYNKNISGELTDEELEFALNF